MPRDSREHLADDAHRLLNSPAARQARADTREALYQMWLDMDSPEDRERVWGMASGFELYWKMMQRYHTGMQVDEVADELKKAVA